MAIVTVKYLNLCSEMPHEVAKEFERWAIQDAHSNGKAVRFRIEEDPAYPIINQYLIDQGIEEGEFVIVHSEW